MESKFISLTSDFGKQTQGIGIMESVIYRINPEAKVVHLMHGLPSFNMFSAAKTMETVYYLPVGCHVCVVDPGVGTERKGIAVKTKRGDILIGPDNGCLMTAPRALGGIEKIVELANEKYMLKPISVIFHGRHVFAPAAAYLTSGVPLEEFGPEVRPEDCAQAPYKEARVEGGKVEAVAIHINHYGSMHLNILHAEWDKLGLNLGEKVELSFGEQKLELPFVKTFGDVNQGEPLILKDDYQRIELAVNQDSFVKRYPLKVGDKVIIKKI